MTDTTDRQRHLIAAYSAYYENLSPDTVDQLSSMVTADFAFTDPFTTVIGPDKVCAYLAKTFSETENPKFDVTHTAFDGDMAFLRWTFSARMRVIGQWDITGMTALTFNKDKSLLTSHVDHWDASQNFYAKIPVLGWFIRRLARRVAAL